MATVAVPFAVLRAGGSATDVGLVTAAGIVPTVALLLFGGVLADRIPRQRVMVGANTVQALSQAVFAAGVLTGRARLWEMAVLVAVRGAANGFYLPAALGLLPQTVPAGHLSSANAIARMGMNSAQIAGAALGGVVVGLLGPGWGPARLLRAASLAVPLLALPLLALAAPLATAVVAAAAFACGAGGEIFAVNWSTAMQQQIPADLLSRVSAYDALGSYALSPVGTAAVGPIAAAVGLTAALAGGGVLIVASAMCVLSVAEVRHLTRHPPVPAELPSADAAGAAGERQPSG